MTERQEWSSVLAGELGQFKGGTGFPIKSQGSASGDFPFYKVADMSLPGNEKLMGISRNYVSAKVQESLGATTFPRHSVVFAKVGAAIFLERKRLLSKPSCIDNNMAAFVPDRNRIDLRFAHHALTNFRLGSLVAVGALPSLNGSQLRSISLMVPPTLREQMQVADALDEADALIASLEQLISKKRDVKQGMMQELLTGRTRLPGFTGEWREVTLGDHVAYLRSVALSRSQLDHESPLRCLHYGDIHTRVSPRLDASTEQLPGVPSYLARTAGRLLSGDLVFADASEDSAGVGKSVEICFVPLEGVVPGLHTIAARFDKSILADGFKAYLQFIPAFRSALLRLAAGTKVLATTRNYISSIELMLPGPNEQVAIASIFEDADAEIEALECYLESARALKVGMMQELLTGRTRLPVKEEA